MKKVLSLLLAVVLVISIFTVVPFSAAEKEVVTTSTQSKSSNFYANYTLTGNGATDMVNIAMAQNERNQPSMGYTESWCADFVSDCAKLAGQGAAVPFNGSVNNMYTAVINAGGTRVSTAQAGDLVFFYASSESELGHVGIALDSSRNISGNIFYQGTSPSKVCILKNSSEGYSHWFYVRPNYKNVSVEDPYAYPSKPTLNIATSQYSSNVTFTWNETTSTTSYELWLYDYDTSKLIDTLYYSKETNNVNVPMDKGKYYAVLKSINSNLANTNRWWTSGDSVPFVVSYCYPSQPILEVLSENESNTVTFNWNKTTNTSGYELWLYNSDTYTVIDTYYYGGEVLSNTLTLPKGNYYAKIKSINNDLADTSRWWTEGDPVYFKVSKDLYLIGDVDGDGEVNIMDATLVQRSVAKLTQFTEAQQSAGDTNKDGDISVVDATIIQRFVAKLIEAF